MKHTKFNLVFRNKVIKSAKAIIKKQASKLEWDLLKQHELFTRLTTLPFKTMSKTKKLGIFIGSAEGLDNVHEAYFLGQKIKKLNKKIQIKYITSGKIGITEAEAKRLNVPGTNAAVMSKLLLEYGLTKDKIITESRSTNTYWQGVEMKIIISKEKFDTIICVTDYWHSARLMLTLIAINPDLKWFSHIIENDKDNIGSALFDWGQRIMQTPLLIAEVARIHKYTEEQTGPLSIEKLKNYYRKFHPEKLSIFEKQGVFSRLAGLYKKTHLETIKKFNQLKNYR